eukprot:SAG31_NODE_8522_length_1437_cov_0.928251_3_plen_86_part_01
MCSFGFQHSLQALICSDQLPFAPTVTADSGRPYAAGTTGAMIRVEILQTPEQTITADALKQALIESRSPVSRVVSTQTASALGRIS